MTWSVEVNGSSQSGPDNQKEHDYLAKKFREFLDQIANDGITQVSYSRLTTNIGTIDLMTGNVVSGTQVPAGQSRR